MPSLLFLGLVLWTPSCKLFEKDDAAPAPQTGQNKNTSDNNRNLAVPEIKIKKKHQQKQTGTLSPKTVGKDAGIVRHLKKEIEKLDEEAEKQAKEIEKLPY
ncbi:MAG: hypothetical protein IPJ88_18415 [Myxococcales bacterium]|nr:MAG: hypothetical protein IPJ88_18415 [Myxococcales bacterium]